MIRRRAIRFFWRQVLISYGSLAQKSGFSNRYHSASRGFSSARSLRKIGAGGRLRFFSTGSTFRSLRQVWGRRQSGWKSERGRGTKQASIFVVERFAEIFNRSDGAGLKCGLAE